MCAAKPPKPKKTVTPPTQFLVNPLTDNLTTRGFLTSRAGRSSLVIRRGPTAPSTMPGMGTTVLPEATPTPLPTRSQFAANLNAAAQYGVSTDNVGKKYKRLVKNYNAGRI